jgi:hypothetical protein
VCNWDIKVIRLLWGCQWTASGLNEASWGRIRDLYRIRQAYYPETGPSKIQIEKTFLNSVYIVVV